MTNHLHLQQNTSTSRHKQHSHTYTNKRRSRIGTIPFTTVYLLAANICADCELAIKL